MMKISSGVKRVLVGFPLKHKHIRTLIEFDSGDIILLNEFEMANIARTFIHILTHPLDKAVELRRKKIEGKEGFALFQLLNTNREQGDIQRDMSNFMSENK